MDPIIGVAISAMGVIAAAFLTSRVSNRKLRSDSALSMIDQLQEENTGLRAEAVELRRQHRIQSDYIGVLRLHIANGHQPPPPAWPAGLIT